MNPFPSVWFARTGMPILAGFRGKPKLKAPLRLGNIQSFGGHLGTNDVLSPKLLQFDQLESFFARHRTKPSTASHFQALGLAPKPIPLFSTNSQRGAVRTLYQTGSRQVDLNLSHVSSICVAVPKFETDPFATVQKLGRRASSAGRTG